MIIHPFLGSLTSSLTRSLTHALAAAAAAQNHILGFKDLASVARRGEGRGGGEDRVGRRRGVVRPSILTSGPRWANSAPREESRK